MTKEHILELISFIDLTTLNPRDTQKSVLQIVQKANTGIKGQRPAAICVFPNFAEYVSRHTDLPIAVVAGCFPTGQTFSRAKAEEVQLAAQTQAKEIDMVINRGFVLSENYNSLADEISLCRQAADEKHLKVILETGELNPEQIRKSSRVAIENGADFIKTSTGKSEVGATAEAAEIMCEEIKKWYDEKGERIGFKPSGGIRTYDDAMIYYHIVQNTLGDDWLTPELFRIGASSLYDNLKSDLEKI